MPPRSAFLLRQWHETPRRASHPGLAGREDPPEAVTAQWLEQWATLMAEKSHDAHIDIVAVPEGMSLPELPA